MIIVFIVVGFTLILLLLYSFFSYLSTITLHHSIDSLCYKDEFILSLQKQQLLLAKKEILGSEFSGSFQNDELDFYKRSYGMTEVRLNLSKSQIKTLVYYHIWKNANSNILSLLTHYAYASTNDLRSFQAQNCRKQPCVHRNLQYLATDAARNLYIKHRDTRFPFTFSRDPLTRFISGMNEIEYRAHHLKNSSFPLQEPLGSQQRIQEFIRMIVSYGGSRSLYQDLEKYEILHIYPMIGTYRTSQKIEGRPIDVLRMEDFDQEWARMTKKLNAPLLYELYRQRGLDKDWRKHNSSYDPEMVIAAANHFFSYAGSDISARLKNTNISSNHAKLPTGYSLSQYESLAKSYLRAVCRIYLIDFQCFNYSLPSACEELRIEYLNHAKEFHFLNSRKDVTGHFMDFLRAALPNVVLEYTARLICYFEDSPDCEANLIHGEPLEFVELHDEL